MALIKNKMKEIFTRLQHKCSTSKHANRYLASIFIVTIFLQCCLFHYLAFHSILISALWKNPLAFMSFYLPKLSICFFFAVFIFLFKRKKWIVICSILINIWIMTELIYSRANSIFLDAYSMTMIDNLDGFWDSIFAFIKSVDFLFCIPTILLILASYLFNNNDINIRYGLYCFIISLVFNTVGLLGIWIIGKEYHENDIKYSYTINPFGKKIKHMIYSEDIQETTIAQYIYFTSVIHHFALNIVDLFRMETDTYRLSISEEEKISQFINPVCTYKEPQTPLIICLLESFETWSISPYTTPNLYNEIKNNQNIIFCPNVISQRRAGVSADGQMIVNTGLLPLQSGAAAFRFPLNKYPSLSELYKKSAAIFPHELDLWNQNYMNIAYSIDSGIVVRRSDKDVFINMISLRDDYDYILGVTIASHAPFTNFSDSSKLEFQKNMPSAMVRYLKCINYTDKCLGLLFEALKNDLKCQNATIVITADHNIFKEEDYSYFKHFEDISGLTYQINQYCPLVIFSKKITGNIEIQDTCYQMDIFPTILHLIGCEDYYWKGFGVNLLDSVARKNRPISEQEAFILSDKLIRANWFESYTKKK